jgi:L-alanine-DL-glutamate epimerase-like enolase superfamily enzyme
MRPRPQQSTGSTPVIEQVATAVYRIPTQTSESDGTLEWDATTLVTVEIAAGDCRGLGYTYADRSAAVLIEDKLADVLRGADPFAIPRCWESMVQETRNLGRPGIVSMAIAACDVALHDLKAKLLDLPLADMLGCRRDRVPVYGSGGFTSYTDEQLCRQLSGWAEEGLRAVKMKVGREPERDAARVDMARGAIGENVLLMVDANGAYDRKQALCFAARFREADVTWFEEPVSSNDLDGLRALRDQAPPGLEITAGEYGYDSRYFLAMAKAGAVDVLQADATRCAGFTGFRVADAIAQACELPLSSHTAPALHLHCCCNAPRLRHMEWFYDHVLIEQLLFDGAPVPRDGCVVPDRTRPGIGLELKHADAQVYRL